MLTDLELTDLEEEDTKILRNVRKIRTQKGD